MIKKMTKLWPAIGFFAAVSAGADQVVPDDLIVQGAACVGFDCVTGEPFVDYECPACSDCSGGC